MGLNLLLQDPRPYQHLRTKNHGDCAYCYRLQDGPPGVDYFSYDGKILRTFRCEPSVVITSTVQLPPVTIDDQVPAAIYLGVVARGPADAVEVYWRVEFDSKFL